MEWTNQPNQPYNKQLTNNRPTIQVGKQASSRNHHGRSHYNCKSQIYFYWATAPSLLAQHFTVRYSYNSGLVRILAAILLSFKTRSLHVFDKSSIECSTQLQQSQNMGLTENLQNLHSSNKSDYIPSSKLTASQHKINYFYILIQ